jgi:HEAT repeat protein
MTRESRPRTVAGLMLSLAVLSAPVIGAQEDIRALTAKLAAPDPVVRAKAACDLRKRDGDAAVAIDALVELLRDAAPVEASVCDRLWGGRDGVLTSPGQLAASALVAIGSRAFPPLMKTLESPAWVARRNAAWALGALDDDRAASALTKVLADVEPQVREQAAWALGALNAESAVPALIAAVRDTDPRVRAQAAWALGAIGDPRALGAVLAALRDADPLVRRQGAWATGVLAR